MAAPLRYLLGGWTLYPREENGYGTLSLGTSFPMGDFAHFRYRSMPISRPNGEPYVTVRLTVVARLMYNSSYQPVVNFYLWDSGRMIVGLYSSATSPAWPTSVGSATAAASASFTYLPVSDDVAHGTGDTRFALTCHAYWSLPGYPPINPPADPFGGPGLSDPRFMEWESIKVEFISP